MYYYSTIFLENKKMKTTEKTTERTNAIIRNTTDSLQESVEKVTKDKKTSSRKSKHVHIKIT